MKKITLLVPCFNEGNSIDLLYEHLQSVVARLVDYKLCFYNGVFVFLYSL